MTSSAEQKIAYFSVCPLCGEARVVPKYRLRRVKAYQCPSCSLIFINPYTPPAAMAHLYDDQEAMARVNPRLATYYERVEGGRTEHFFDLCLDQLKEQLPAGKKSLLDIGCGNGFFLSRAQRQGWEVCGLDPSRENCNLAKNNYGVEAIPVAFENYESKNRYDCVSMWDFIEHVPNPLEILEKAKRFLKPGGILLVATPNHFSLINFLADMMYQGTGGRLQKQLEVLFVPEHILYFTERTLRLLVQKIGFCIMKVVKTGTDIDRFKTGRLFNLTAKVLLILSRWLRWENRIVLFARKESQIFMEGSSKGHEV